MVQESSTARTTLLRFGHDAMGWTRSGGGSLGFGVGAAIGAKIAVGRERPVVLHLGDGALTCSAAGVWTMARYNTAILTLISNNETYQVVRTNWAREVPESKMVHTGKYPGLYLDAPATDYAGLARSQGVEGETVKTLKDLEAALRRGVDKTTRENKPYVIDVKVQREGVAGSAEAAVAAHELAVDPAALDRAEEGHEARAILGLTHPTLGIAPSEFGQLVVRHPAGVGRPRVDHVRGDPASVVSEFGGRGEHDAIQRALTGAVRQVAGDVVAGERDDATAAGRSAKAPCELTHEQPARARVHREVAVEALHRRRHDVAVDAFRMGEDERGHRTHRRLDPVEDPRGRLDQAQVGLDRDRPGARRLDVVAAPCRVCRIGSPGHALVVGAPARRRDVPARARQA